MTTELTIGWATGLRSDMNEILGVLRETGISTLQAGYLPELDNPEGVEMVRSALRPLNARITAVIAGFGGDDWSDIPSIFRTVGLAPTSTRPSRFNIMRRIAAFANGLDVRVLTTHVGRLPEASSGEAFHSLVSAMRDLCDELRQRNQVLAMETGQEPASCMCRFLNAVGRDNLRVNFDPANFLLYGQDRPISALRELFGRVESVHCKDGCWPEDPRFLGLEQRLAEGEVGFERWLTLLLATGYRGPLIIETGAKGKCLIRDLQRAKSLIESIVARAASPAWHTKELTP